MRSLLGALLTLLACANPTGAAERIVFGDDGSIQWQCAGSDAMVLRLGLPRVPAARLWREGQALRGVWLTNGIRYTQTVLVRSAQEDTNSGPKRSLPAVLLVNLQGENANSEYTEARADLTLQTGAGDGLQTRPTHDLELKEGYIWVIDGERRSLTAALEIPDSGVKTTRGTVLCFAGNMPPSEKGSMTVKIPLRQIQNEAEKERLSEIDFAEELRRSLKAGKSRLTNAKWELVFSGKLTDTGAH